LAHHYRKVGKGNAKTRLLAIWREEWRKEDSFVNRETFNNHFSGDCFRAGKRRGTLCQQSWGQF